jgi:hypothetical protein
MLLWTPQGTRSAGGTVSLGTPEEWDDPYRFFGW